MLSHRIEIATLAAFALAILAIPNTASAALTGAPTLATKCAPQAVGGKANVKPAILVPYKQHQSTPSEGTITLNLNECFGNIDNDTVFLAATNRTIPTLFAASNDKGKLSSVSAYLPSNIEDGTASTSAPAAGVALSSLNLIDDNTFKYTGSARTIELKTDVRPGTEFATNDVLTVTASNGSDSTTLSMALLPQILGSLATAAIATSTAWSDTNPRKVTLTSGLPISNDLDITRDLCIDNIGSCTPDTTLPNSGSSFDYRQQGAKTHEVALVTAESTTTKRVYQITPASPDLRPVYLRFKLEIRTPSTPAYIIENSTARLVTGADDIGTETLSVPVGVTSNPTAVISVNNDHHASEAVRLPYTETSGVADAINLSSAGSQNIDSAATYCWTLTYSGAGTTPANIGALSGTPASGCQSGEPNPTYTPPNQTTDLTVTIGLTITPTAGSPVMASRMLTVDRSRQTPALKTSGLNPCSANNILLMSYTKHQAAGGDSTQLLELANCLENVGPYTEFDLEVLPRSNAVRPTVFYPDGITFLTSGAGQTAGAAIDRSTGSQGEFVFDSADVSTYQMPVKIDSVLEDFSDADPLIVKLTPTNRFGRAEGTAGGNQSDLEGAPLQYSIYAVPADPFATAVISNPAQPLLSMGERHKLTISSGLPLEDSEFTLKVKVCAVKNCVPTDSSAELMKTGDTTVDSLYTFTTDDTNYTGVYHLTSTANDSMNLVYVALRVEYKNQYGSIPPFKTVDAHQNLDTIKAGQDLSVADIPDQITVKDKAFSLVLPEAVGGNGTAAYNLTTSALPAGLTFDAGTHTLSGTPTATANAVSLTYTVTRGEQTVTTDFMLSVEVNIAPTLLNKTFTVAAQSRSLMEPIIMSLPAGGNGGVVDTLSGTYAPDGDSMATAVTVDETTGDISLQNVDTGLTFTKRVGTTKATITGTPEVTGIFKLVYKVVDNDAYTGPDDEVKADITLEVLEAALTMTGGLANKMDFNLPENSIDLKKGGALTANITLPQVTAGNSADGTITYVLAALHTVNNAGMPTGNRAAVPVTANSAALPGLTLTAHNGATAGYLRGTPTTAGEWRLTYTATDDKNTADTSDDTNGGISFTVKVIEDSQSDFFEGMREAALNGGDNDDPNTFNYWGGFDLSGLGASGFEMPAIIGGNGAITHSLTTTCALSGGSCTAAVTAGSNPAPAGLTFNQPSGSMPASLTGTFTGAMTDGETRLFTLTYTATDTAIGDGTYQASDMSDMESVSFKIQVLSDAPPVLESTPAITEKVEAGVALATPITLPVASEGNMGLTDSLTGTHRAPDSIVDTLVQVDMTPGPTFGDIILASGGEDGGIVSGLKFTERVDGTSAAMINGTPIAGAVGIFKLTYTVVDGDSNEESSDVATEPVEITVQVRPAFASATPTATLAENANGSVAGAPVMVTDLTVTGTNANAKSYTLVSVNGQTSGTDDYGKFAVAAKTGAEGTTAEVTYVGTGEDYEALKAAVLEDCIPSGTNTCEPTYELVIGVTDSISGYMATDNTTLTVTVTDENDMPTYVRGTLSPKLLEQRPSNDADGMAATDDDPLPLATLTFDDQDITDTTLTYSVVGVDPASLGGTNFSNFSVAAKSSTDPLMAELSFKGDGNVIDYATVKSFTVTVRAADDESSAGQVEQDVTVTVLENAAPPVVDIELVGSQGAGDQPDPERHRHRREHRRWRYPELRMVGDRRRPRLRLYRRHRRHHRPHLHRGQR